MTLLAAGTRGVYPVRSAVPERALWDPNPLEREAVHRVGSECSQLSLELSGFNVVEMSVVGESEPGGDVPTGGFASSDGASPLEGLHLDLQSMVSPRSDGQLREDVISSSRLMKIDDQWRALKSRRRKQSRNRPSSSRHARSELEARARHIWLSKHGKLSVTKKEKKQERMLKSWFRTMSIDGHEIPYEEFIKTLVRHGIALNTADAKHIAREAKIRGPVVSRETFLHYFQKQRMPPPEADEPLPEAESLRDELRYTAPIRAGMVRRARSLEPPKPEETSAFDESAHVKCFMRHLTRGDKNLSIENQILSKNRKLMISHLTENENDHARGGAMVSQSPSQAALDKFRSISSARERRSASKPGDATQPPSPLYSLQKEWNQLMKCILVDSNDPAVAEPSSSSTFQLTEALSARGPGGKLSARSAASRGNGDGEESGGRDAAQEPSGKGTYAESKRLRSDLDRYLSGEMVVDGKAKRLVETWALPRDHIQEARDMIKAKCRENEICRDRMKELDKMEARKRRARVRRQRKRDASKKSQSSAARERLAKETSARDKRATPAEEALVMVRRIAREKSKLMRRSRLSSRGPSSARRPRKVQSARTKKKAAAVSSDRSQERNLHLARERLFRLKGIKDISTKTPRFMTETIMGGAPPLVPQSARSPVNRRTGGTSLGSSSARRPGSATSRR